MTVQVGICNAASSQHPLRPPSLLFPSASLPHLFSAFRVDSDSHVEGSEMANSRTDSHSDSQVEKRAKWRTPALTATARQKERNGELLSTHGWAIDGNSYSRSLPRPPPCGRAQPLSRSSLSVGRGSEWSPLPRPPPQVELGGSEMANSSRPIDRWAIDDKKKKRKSRSLPRPPPSERVHSAGAHFPSRGSGPLTGARAVRMAQPEGPNHLHLVLCV